MQVAKRLLLTSFLSIPLLVVGCAKNSGSTDNLPGLEKMESANKLSERANTGRIRERAIKEAALSIAAQSSLFKRSEAINKVLDAQAKHLDRIYNFHAMVLENNILPPVLVEGRTTMKVDNDAAIRLSDRTYNIHKQARFISAPPNWRDYLQMHFQKPDRPDNTLLPQTRKEREIWVTTVEKGWAEGRKQANSIFADNLARLTRDYKGMVLYRILLAQHMVSEPHVEKTNLGVTGGGDNMRVNDKVLRITSMPFLDTRSNKWNPAISEKAKRKGLPY